MKIRQAKKILFAKHWTKRYEKLRLYILTNPPDV